MALQFRRGEDADRTSVTPLAGEPLWITDTDELYIGDGSTAGGVLITGGGGGGAPTNATYIVQTSNGTLTNEQALASLATGILKNTTTTGVLSIATGSDLPSHTHTLADITDDGTMAAQNANNVAITGGSLTDVTVTTGTYSSRVNEAILHKARKSTAGTINKGDVVYIVGSSGSHVTVELADADVAAQADATLGFAATSITSGADGFIIIEGELNGLSNVSTATYTDGDKLWLSDTAGAFTKTRPTQPKHGVSLGWVISASSGSAGRIYVKIKPGEHLEYLHDVLLTTPADNHFLVYDNATSLWKNESPSDARTSLGLGTAATSNTGDFAAANHNHAAGDINSGTLAIARGGTNLGTTPTNGQLLIGNGTGYTLAALTAGTGITVTNGSGSITLAATAGAFDPATKSESFCDFIGDAISPFATNGAGTGSTVTYSVAGNSDHPGVAEAVTGTANTGRRFVGSSQVDELVFGTRSHTFSTAVTVPTLSDATDTYTVFAGFIDLLTGTPTNGAYFRYSHGINGGDWQCVTANASTETTTDSNVAVTASTWNRLDIEVNAAGTSVVFKIDGNTVATHTTNIPTAGVGVGCNIRKSVGTTSRTVQMDYLYHSSAVTR